MWSICRELIELRTCNIKKTFLCVWTVFQKFPIFGKIIFSHHGFRSLCEFKSREILCCRCENYFSHLILFNFFLYAFYFHFTFHFVHSFLCKTFFSSSICFLQVKEFLFIKGVRSKDILTGSCNLDAKLLKSSIRNFKRFLTDFLNLNFFIFQFNFNKIAT